MEELNSKSAPATGRSPSRIWIGAWMLFCGCFSGCCLSYRADMQHELPSAPPVGRLPSPTPADSTEISTDNSEDHADKHELQPVTETETGMGDSPGAHLEHRVRCSLCGLKCRGRCRRRPWRIWHSYGHYLMPPPESEELVMPIPRFHPVPTEPAFSPRPNALDILVDESQLESQP